MEYWREYRTYFYIGQSWGVNESTVLGFKSEESRVGN
ncbi:MAG: transposase family protein [Hassallia sp. WJT32-NPBG1]|nr:transposase family protein [Hassallia sp. WJT32-NPBG1]